MGENGSVFIPVSHLLDWIREIKQLYLEASAAAEIELTFGLTHKCQQMTAAELQDS